MPLKSGHSYATVQANMVALMRAGKSREQAAAIAMANARRCYFKKYPQGALPEWLAFNGRRLIQYYHDGGTPVAKMYPTMQENPAPRTEIQQAARRFTRFTGITDPELKTVRVPARSKVALAIGPVLGIMYQTERDGRIENYRHMFRDGSRPLLTASQDGKQLNMLGGAYTFTERGIVDKGRRKS